MLRHCLVLTGRLQLVVGRSFVTKTCVAQAKIVELVPALGESITEGSIAKWSKNVGDHVAIDDVVVIVETDKVTVDIKSTNAGVLTAQLATDTVVVGHPLFELDTDGIATSAPKSTTVKVTTNAAPIEAAPSSTDHHSRTPLIKFLGKRSLLPKGSTSHSSSAVSSSSKTTAVKATAAPTISKPVKEGTGVDFATLKGGAWYGRPRISDAEMQAIESGGAF